MDSEVFRTWLVKTPILRFVLISLTGALDFSFPPVLVGDRNGKPLRLRNDDRRMVQVRPFRGAADLVGDLTDLFRAINKLPVERVGSRELENIMSMYRRPERVRFSV